MLAGAMTAGISFLLFLVGLWGYFAGQKHRAQALASAGWPHAVGRVTSSEVRQEQRTRRVNDEDQYYWVYRPEIAYAYEANGASYSGRRIGFSDLTKGVRQDAERIAQTYPVGSEVKVFYDPADPASATLDTSAAGTSNSIYLSMAVAAGGLVGTLVGLVMMLRAV